MDDKQAELYRKLIEKAEKNYQDNVVKAPKKDSRGPASVEPSIMDMEIPENVQYDPAAERRLREQVRKAPEQEKAPEFTGSYHKGYKKRLNQLRDFFKKEEE